MNDLPQGFLPGPLPRTAQPASDGLPPGFVLGPSPGTSVPSSSAPQSFQIPQLTPEQAATQSAMEAEKKRSENATSLPSVWEKIGLGEMSASGAPAEHISQMIDSHREREKKFVAENTAPDNVPLDINDTLDASTRFAFSHKGGKELFDALESEGLHPRPSADGQNIIVRTPDQKKDVLYYPYGLPNIAGDIAPVLEGAGKMAAGALVGQPELGMAGRGAALLSVPATTLAAGGSGKQAAIDTALTAAPVLATGALGALGRKVATGAQTPIETRGVPALSRLTGEAVPAEISTGRPVLARAANAPLTGNLPQTSSTIDSALAAEKYRVAGEAMPQAQLHEAVQGALKGEGGYLDTAIKEFSAKEAPILSAVAESDVAPSLSKTSQYVEGVAQKYGKQINENSHIMPGEISADASTKSTGDAFNRAVSDIRKKQMALENTDGLTVDNLLANRRALDNSIDFEATDDVSRDILKGYRDAINDDIEATLKTIPKEQQAAFSKANNDLTPAAAFRANNEAFTEASGALDNRAIRSALAPGSNPEKLFTYLRGDGSDAKSISGLYDTLDKVNPETSASLRQGVLGDVLNDVRAKPPANVDASQYNRVDADKLDKLTGRVGGEIVDKDARSKYTALLGDEGIAFLDDLSDTSRLLEKNKALSEGERLTSPKVFSKELLAAKGGVITQSAKALVDLATAIPRIGMGAGLRNEAVNRFLATGELPAFVAPLTQATAAAGAVARPVLAAPVDTRTLKTEPTSTGVTSQTVLSRKPSR